MLEKLNYHINFDTLTINYHITFDIDWCPDFCIEHTLNLLEKKRIKATFFVTHYSDILNDLISSGHELGIHPNFFENSSQGSNVSEVMDNLLKIVPNSRLIRMHGLYQSTNLLFQIFKNYKNLKYDLSLYTPGINSQKIHWSYNGVDFIRYNFNWEDDFYLDNKNFISINKLEKKTIFNFHPIHIFLNSFSFNAYNNLKLEHDTISSLTKIQMLKFKQSGYGTESFFNEITTSNHKSISLEEF